jgi:hypothetical protein
MWSHYANHHRGIRVKYKCGDILKYLPNNCVLAPVVYREAYPKITDYYDEYKLYQGALIKATYWGYENEWRIISINKIQPNKPGFITQGCCPASICIGQHRKDLYISDNPTMLKEYPSWSSFLHLAMERNINFYDAVICKDKFDMRDIHIIY